jgi:hypothetical protein
LSSENSALLDKRIEQNLIYDYDVFFNNCGYSDNFLESDVQLMRFWNLQTTISGLELTMGLLHLIHQKKITDSGLCNIQITAVKIANETMDWASLDKKSRYQLSTEIMVINFPTLYLIH